MGVAHSGLRIFQSNLTWASARKARFSPGYNITGPSALKPGDCSLLNAVRRNRSDG